MWAARVELEQLTCWGERGGGCCNGRVSSQISIARLGAAVVRVSAAVVSSLHRESGGRRHSPPVGIRRGQCSRVLKRASGGVECAERSGGATRGGCTVMGAQAFASLAGSSCKGLLAAFQRKRCGSDSNLRALFPLSRSKLPRVPVHVPRSVQPPAFGFRGACDKPRARKAIRLVCPAACLADARARLGLQRPLGRTDTCAPLHTAN